MTRYFMRFTPLFAAEVQMMTPPRHQPRRSGRIRSSFRYSADDVRCKDCTRYDSGHPCHLNECVCLEERIEAGVVELNALARECFGGRLFRPLQRRLRDELNRQPFRFFLGDAHRERWTHWKNRCYGVCPSATRLRCFCLPPMRSFGKESSGISTAAASTSPPSASPVFTRSCIAFIRRRRPFPLAVTTS